MSESPQYRATGLRETLKTQGRKARWLAEKAGVHESLLSHAMSGNRTINGAAAARIADLLGVPFFVLFELASESTSVASVNREEAA